MDRVEKHSPEINRRKAHIRYSSLAEHITMKLYLINCCCGQLLATAMVASIAHSWKENAVEEMLAIGKA